MGYVKSCCDAAPQGKTYFRQARNLATGVLVDEWFEAKRVPAGPADFKLYSYQSNRCLVIRFTDPLVAFEDGIGTVGNKWDAINSAVEESLVCATGPGPTDVYLPFSADDGSGGDYRDLAFSFTGPVVAGGTSGTVVTATAIGTVTFHYICDRATATCHHALQVFRVRAGVSSAVSGVFSDTRDGGGGSVSFSVQTGDVLRVQISAASGGCATIWHDDPGVSVSGNTCPDAPPEDGGDGGGPDGDSEFCILYTWEATCVDGVKTVVPVSAQCRRRSELTATLESWNVSSTIMWYRIGAACTEAESGSLTDFSLAGTPPTAPDDTVLECFPDEE